MAIIEEKKINIEMNNEVRQELLNMVAAAKRMENQYKSYKKHFKIYCILLGLNLGAMGYVIWTIWK